MPTKEEILKFPSKEVFDEEMAKLDKKIKELRQQKDELCDKRREVIDGGKVQGSSMTYRETFNLKLNSLKEVNQRKRDCQGQLKQITEELETLEGEKRILLKALPHECNTEEAVQSAIKQMEYKHNTSSYKNATEENKVIKDMRMLKDVLPKAKRFSEIKPKL